MQQSTQRAAIYVCKSTESEKRQAHSIDSQIDELIDYGGSIHKTFELEFNSGR